jgi:hypothetical protein
VNAFNIKSSSSLRLLRRRIPSGKKNVGVEADHCGTDRIKRLTKAQ